jgi:hypothetical protein
MLPRPLSRDAALLTYSSRLQGLQASLVVRSASLRWCVMTTCICIFNTISMLRYGQLNFDKCLYWSRDNGQS